ncbi:MAG: pyruvate formate-lyase-activating protein [Bacillota bacterium]
MTEGYIHSLESLGTVDGPGIRFVVFTQGCPLRCQYCHNPDTWKLKAGTKVSTSTLIKKIIKIKPYLEGAGGGLTISGGEPTMQPEFTLDLLKKAKAENLHTALDTSGFVEIEQFKKFLAYLDLVLIDIKSFNNSIHQELTGVSNQKTLAVIELLEKAKKPYWVRQVIVPQITDQIVEIKKLAKFLSQKKYLEKVELLPYHELGKHKWEKLGLEYKLAAVKPPSPEKMAKLNALFENYRIKIA